MIHSALALQKAIYNTLSGDTEMTAELGANSIYDVVPEQAVPPYVSFGTATHADWSTGTETGTEHTIEINIWSDRRGRRQALRTSAIAERLLKDLSGPIQDHVLINFQHVSTEISRNHDQELFRGKLTFRAVTEPQVSSI